MTCANLPDPCKNVDCGAGLKCAPLGRSYSCIGKNKNWLCALEKNNNQWVHWNPVYTEPWKFCCRLQYCLPFKDLHGSRGSWVYHASFFLSKICPVPCKLGMKLALFLVFENSVIPRYPVGIVKKKYVNYTNYTWNEGCVASQVRRKFLTWGC